MTHGDKTNLRRNQLLYLKRKLNSHCTYKIFGGDLNGDIRESSEIFNDYTTETSRIPTQWRGNAIDHIYVNENIKIMDSYTWYTGSSDHLPVIADLELVLL